MYVIAHFYIILSSELLGNFCLESLFALWTGFLVSLSSYLLI